MLYLYSNLGDVSYNPPVEVSVKDVLNQAVDNSSRKVSYKLLYLLLAVWLPLKQQERLAAVWNGLLCVLHLPASCMGIFLHSRNCQFARAVLTTSQMGPLPPAISDQTAFAGLLKKSTDKIAWGDTQVLSPPEVVCRGWTLIWVVEISLMDSDPQLSHKASQFPRNLDLVGLDLGPGVQLVPELMSQNIICQCIDCVWSRWKVSSLCFFGALCSPVNGCRSGAYAQVVWCQKWGARAWHECHVGEDDPNPWPAPRVPLGMQTAVCCARGGGSLHDTTGKSFMGCLCLSFFFPLRNTQNLRRFPFLEALW